MIGGSPIGCCAGDQSSRLTRFRAPCVCMGYAWGWSGLKSEGAMCMTGAAGQSGLKSEGAMRLTDRGIMPCMEHHLELVSAPPQLLLDQWSG